MPETNLPALPNVADARLPAVYETAQQALNACDRIDECKNWADKAAALASYARQANDDSMRLLAVRIQARALRRAGQLLKNIKAANGARTDLGTAPTRGAAATEAGLSERQRKTALRVASVPAADFAAAVESADPPTVTELAERGKQTAPSVPRPLRVHTDRLLMDLITSLENSLLSDISPLVNVDEIDASMAAEYAEVIDQALPALAALRDRLETRASRAALPD